MVNLENYEEYLILYADGELDEAAETVLMAFIAEHPELKGELAAYEAAHLEPDESLVFGAKESLLRPVPARKVIPLKSWWAYGAAAGLLVLLGVRLARFTDRPALSGQPAIASNAAAAHRPVIQQVTVAPVTVVVNVVQVQLPPKTTPMPKREATPRTVPASEIAAIAPVSSPLAVETMTPALPEAVMSTPPLATNDQKTSSPITFGAERPEILTALKDAANERIEQVRKIRKAIKGADIAVSLGQTELFTLHF